MMPPMSDPMEQPLTKLGPITRMTKSMEALAAASQQQTEAMQAMMQMAAHQTQMMSALIQSVDRLSQALMARKQVRLQKDETGRATGATVTLMVN